MSQTSSYRIPLFDLNFDQAEERAVLQVLRSKWISMGPKTAELEQRFAGMLGARHAVALANCTVALHLALRILGIGEGDEVICPSLTFVAAANAIRYVNATPVFCDIKSLEDLTIDPVMAESLVTKRTRAIMVMHYAGFPCDMTAITKIARRHKLKVIEDACHGPLSEYHGKKLGTIGDIGCFSFFSNKNISTGEGGMMVTNNDEYAGRARLLRSHGMTTMSYDRARGHSTSYDVIDLGYNYRMDDVRAAIGLAQLKKLEKDLRKRQDVRRFYLEELAGTTTISIPFSHNREFVSNYIFPIVLKKANQAKRENIRQSLHAAGIQTSVHYPSVHKFTIFKRCKDKLPKTEYISQNEITLPMYSSLYFADIQFIVKKLNKSLG